MKCEKCGGEKIAPCPAKCGAYFCDCGHYHDSDDESICPKETTYRGKKAKDIKPLRISKYINGGDA